MCNLLVAVSKTKDNKNFIETITSQFPTMRSQKNGIGAFVVTHDNTFHLFREFSDYDIVFDKVEELLPTARLVGLHTRISTGGKLGIENVHFFEHDNVILAHNGIIHGYTKSTYRQSYWDKKDDDAPMVVLDSKAKRTVEEQVLFDESLVCEGCLSSKAGTCKRHIKKAQDLIKKQEAKALEPHKAPLWGTEPSDDDCPAFPDNPCDSLEFLRDLEKPVTCAGIDNLIHEKDASGMIMVFDKNTKKAFVSIRKECYAISDKETFSVMFSFTPDTEFKDIKWKYMFGVPFKDKMVTHKLAFPKKTLSYGTWEIKY